MASSHRPNAVDEIRRKKKGPINGYYILETIVDPDNALVEKDETNNCGSVLIRLTEVGTAPQHAEIIRTGPPCR